MGKHSTRKQEAPPRQDPSQTLAWRSIGCVLMLAIPAISIAGALVTIDSYAVYYIPRQLMGYPVLPDYLFATDGLTTIFTPIAHTKNLYAISVISVAYAIVLGGLISLLYAVIYRIANPRRYGPFDAPPPKIKAKKYRR